MRKASRANEVSFVEDLILACTGEGVASEQAQKAVRALCRWFGGQMIYIPGKKEQGKTAEVIRGVIAEAVGDYCAQFIMERIMSLYGYLQLYIPFERKAFRKTIALEIFELVGTNGLTMNDLARKYNISFTLAYKLRNEGWKEKKAPSMPFLPFLELKQ
jgi:Mor family transcriptional regulator